MTKRTWGLPETIRAWFDSTAGEEADKTPDHIDLARIIPFIGMHLACLLVFWVGVSPTALLTGVALLTLERELARQAFLHLRRSGYRLRNVAVIGDNAEGAALRRMFDTSPELGYRFAGYVTVDTARHHARPGEVLGGLDEADEVLRRNNVTTAMIAASAVDLAHTSILIRKLLNAGINVELSPVLPDVAVERLSIRRLGRFPVMFLQPFHQAGWRSWAKRSFDLVVAGGGLLVLSLPLLVVCVLVRLDSDGPVFFRQTRVGRDGRLFEVIKFRTMVRNAHAMRHELVAHNEADGPLFKIRNDPRITRVGRFLRKASIDELPQLWNVLRGEMSLVGPRPALPDEAAGPWRVLGTLVVAFVGLSVFGTAASVRKGVGGR